MNPESTQTNGDPAIAARIETIAAKVKADSERTEAQYLEWVSTQTTEAIPCPRHPDVRLDFDELATKASMRDGSGFTLRYRDCPVCNSDRILREGGVPAVLMHARFENFEACNDIEQSFLDTARSFADQKVGFLILMGGVGTGKGHLAVAIMRSFRSPAWVKQSTLLRLLRDTYRDPYAPDPVRRYQRADLLVLDEVGLSGGGRDEFPMIHEILDWRYCERKPTILTTNISKEQLREILGDRMADRVDECCFATLCFGGQSRRRSAKTRYFASVPAQSLSSVEAPADAQ